MGPRLRVDTETFLREVESSGRKVIRGPKVWLQGYTYMVCGDEYYYYTISKEELKLPETIEINSVKQILL